VQLRCGSKLLDLSRPVVMGVLNVTPDSFSDGGRFQDVGHAVAHALELLAQGAAIIDIGGESTRPGAPAVEAAEEARRILPVIERLRSQTAAIISVDTSKPEIMSAAAAAGADLINDVRALLEPGAQQAALLSGCAVCLMHMQGDPRTMQTSPSYRDVVQEVGAFLHERAQSCLAAGFAADRIVLDPGFGFGKTVEHNLQLLRQLQRLQQVSAGPERLGWPLLVGLSRKSTVGRLTGRELHGRTAGSVALAVIAARNGAHIVRANDVAATVDALKVVAAVKE